MMDLLIEVPNALAWNGPSGTYSHCWMSRALQSFRITKPKIMSSACFSLSISPIVDGWPTTTPVRALREIGIDVGLATDGAASNSSLDVWDAMALTALIQKSTTGDPRWLRLATKIRDRKVLDPLAAKQNDLPGLHANTQIPKVIGIARLHELTGNAGDGVAARFFHDTVTGKHSYVIGGNSEREHFREPGVIAAAITDRAYVLTLGRIEHEIQAGSWEAFLADERLVKAYLGG